MTLLRPAMLVILPTSAEHAVICFCLKRCFVTHCKSRLLLNHLRCIHCCISVFMSGWLRALVSGDDYLRCNRCRSSRRRLLTIVRVCHQRNEGFEFVALLGEELEDSLQEVGYTLSEEWGFGLKGKCIAD